MRNWITWMAGYILIQWMGTLNGQVAVSVVSDAAESMTNVHRFRQYALQAEQFLQEADYWVETGTQLYTVIDRLGSPHSFWVKMGAVLDAADLSGKIAGDQEWGTDWFPDDYLRMLREGNRFGQLLDENLGGSHHKEVSDYLDRARYFMSASIEYVRSTGNILKEMERKQEAVLETASEVVSTEVSEEEGIAGIMEKSIALDLLKISSGETTNALLRTMIQSDLEAFSIEQMNRLAEWEYRQSREEEQITKSYQQRHKVMDERMEHLERDMERESRLVDSEEDSPKRHYFQYIRE